MLLWLRRIHAEARKVSQSWCLQCLLLCRWGYTLLAPLPPGNHHYTQLNLLHSPILSRMYISVFMQCIRRLCEEKDSVHGYNALKYMLTIIAVIIRTAFELKKGRNWMILALVSSGVAICMNTFWDIVIDWGLLRRHSKNPYLRDKLLVPHKSVYFAAMVTK